MALLCICSTDETNLLKSVHVVNIFEIQTKWTEFRPNSDHYWANGLNSDQLRKIIPEWQQCISPKLQKALIVQLYSYMLAGHSKEKVHS